MYKIVSIESGLMFTFHPEYKQQVWSLAKLTKKHKNDDCAICDLSVGDVAWRPITNLGNRMKRICQRHKALPPPLTDSSGVTRGRLQKVKK